MFYEQEDNYKTLNDLIKAIDDYIYYYNYDIIKEKVKRTVSRKLQVTIL